MYALEDDIAVLGHLRRAFRIEALVVDEVKAPEVNFLSREQRVYVLGEPRRVDRLYRLVVECAVGVAGIPRVAHEVVVGREVQGIRAVDPELRAEPLRRRCLAGRRAAAKENDPDVLLRADRVGKRGKRLYLPCLADADKLVYLACLDCLVQFFNRHLDHPSFLFRTTYGSKPGSSTSFAECEDFAISTDSPAFSIATFSPSA